MVSPSIREMRADEYHRLDDFLYEAIFIPEGAIPPPRSVILQDELQVYVKAFGSHEADKCFVAEADGELVGAVWVRIMPDYGHIDDETPSFAISLYKNFRGLRIGRRLMQTMLAHLKGVGYAKCSLSVQKANYAVRLYKSLGFEIIAEHGEEYIMLRRLDG